MNTRNLRTVVSSNRNSVTGSGSCPTVRTVVGTKTIDSKGFLKVTPTTLMSSPLHSTSVTSSVIKEEPLYEEESINNHRQLKLTGMLIVQIKYHPNLQSFLVTIFPTS